MEIKKVGVIGCGLMGAGITQVSAQSGYQVVVLEVNQEFLNKGLASIDKFLTGSVTRGRLSQVDKDAIIGRIKGTTDNRDFGDCDLIIEAATENIALKKQIFTDLGKVSAKRAILATNTT
ncbi:MAG: 3-hydroxyacyl-CoA dehydrogenase NAD-binding domain-containing protein, partial [Dehalococcoidales bacterium]|nr:3-hydroxyacyl-CoA dehydrogenase NAD-binding domain-containing protein [Dehalococcoidales bacterium]